MLQFEVYLEGEKATDVELTGAYLFGQDSIPVRAELVADGGLITCVKKVPGAAGLTMLWEAGSAGKFMLSTTRLPEREQPYCLNLEMARGQMMRLIQKFEEWGLFDYGDAQHLVDELDTVKHGFIEALKADTPGGAARMADEALAAGVTLGEKMALFHAEIFLSRRKGPASRAGFGCTVDLSSAPTEKTQELLRDAFDFITVPLPWKQIEPKEGQCQFALADAWVNWAVTNRKRILAGPLLSFQQDHMPEWLYVFEHDYDNLRDVAYEHIQQVVKRYEKHVRAWHVVSGIHAHNSFNFSFEQLMELTRMSCMLVKKVAPKAQAVIDVVMPWGEYYATNTRSIPPMLYADMAVQSGVKFDAFGLQLFMGAATEGHFVRDLMQLSAMLDEFVQMGKPLHITAIGAPSELSADAGDAFEGKALASAGGRWHAPWSQRLQAEWLQAVYRVAMSKPYVESISWRDLTDSQPHYMPHGGLCQSDTEPKLAYKELRNFRVFLATPRTAAGANPAAGNTSSKV